uniref:Uncharacterized protein n=2 Tax=Crassostrea virginica TaxID=6565 RepID=A0A8B8DLD9_CRAVI|nr:putative protein TPRXL isoform X1 [Crassostrea virginica]
MTTTRYEFADQNLARGLRRITEMRQGPGMLVKWMAVLPLVVLLLPCISDASSSPAITSTNATTPVANGTAGPVTNASVSSSTTPSVSNPSSAGTSNTSSAGSSNTSNAGASNTNNAGASNTNNAATSVTTDPPNSTDSRNAADSPMTKTFLSVLSAVTFIFLL